jgi:protein-arginine kinase activator protein McsA
LMVSSCTISHHSSHIFNTTHARTRTRTYISMNNRVTYLNGEALSGTDYCAACHVTLHDIITSVVLSCVTCFSITCWDQELLKLLKANINLI